MNIKEECKGLTLEQLISLKKVAINELERLEEEKSYLKEYQKNLSYLSDLCSLIKEKLMCSFCVG